MKEMILESEKFWFAMYAIFITLVLLTFNYFGFL